MPIATEVNKIEIPMTRELRDFFANKYHNQSSKLVDDFLIYLHTQKEAHEINKALHEVKLGETREINKLFNEL